VKWQDICVMKKIIMVLILGLLLVRVLISSTPSVFNQSKAVNKEDVQEIVISEYLAVIHEFFYDEEINKWVGIFFLSNMKEFPFAISFMFKPEIEDKKEVNLRLIYEGPYYYKGLTIILFTCLNWNYTEN
jgi:hypothetical protein